MELEKCIDSALFKLKEDQAPAREVLSGGMEMLKSDDLTMRSLAPVALRAGLAGIGERSCSAKDEAFATARCSRPEEFNPKKIIKSL